MVVIADTLVAFANASDVLTHIVTETRVATSKTSVVIAQLALR